MSSSQEQQTVHETLFEQVQPVALVPLTENVDHSALFGTPPAPVVDPTNINTVIARLKEKIDNQDEKEKHKNVHLFIGYPGGYDHEVLPEVGALSLLVFINDYLNPDGVEELTPANLRVVINCESLECVAAQFFIWKKMVQTVLNGIVKKHIEEYESWMTPQLLLEINLESYWKEFCNERDEFLDQEVIPCVIRAKRYDVLANILEWFVSLINESSIYDAIELNDEKAFDMIYALLKPEDHSYILSQSIKWTFMHGMNVCEGKKIEKPEEIVEVALKVHNFGLVREYFDMLPEDQKFIDPFLSAAMPNIDVIKSLIMEYPHHDVIDITYCLTNLLTGGKTMISEFDELLSLPNTTYIYTAVLRFMMTPYLATKFPIRDLQEDIKCILDNETFAAIAEKYGIPHGVCEICKNCWINEHEHKGCKYVPTKGEKKGTMCGRIPIEGQQYCKSCITKKGAQQLLIPPPTAIEAFDQMHA